MASITSSWIQACRLGKWETHRLWRVDGKATFDTSLIELDARFLPIQPACQ
jgi:hypothetical protein